VDGWLTEAKGCGVPALANFAAGLESDGAAIRAALTDPASSGPAEGQINRLKLIKRQGYGHAGLDLLRRRMILAERRANRATVLASSSCSTWATLAAAALSRAETG